MIDAPNVLLGPLAGPECLRASRRAWVIWVRMVAAFAAGSVLFVALWVAEFTRTLDPFHFPYMELRTALATVEGMILAFAMILSPAVLAGSLAGEKERGSIGLLLTTRVNALDVILGRLAGRLSQVLMIELAAAPGLLLLATYAGMGWAVTLSLLALPAAVSFGGGGIALAASALSRRGRDALLFVYLMYVLFLLSPLVGSLGPAWVGLLSPFESLNPLVADEATGPALLTAAIWAVMGLASLALGAWRLRPSCLSEGDDVRGRKRARRRGAVPPVTERPMLWKELYVERVGTLGRAGRWIGGALVAWLALGSLALAGVEAWSFFKDPDGAWGIWAVEQASYWYGQSSTPIVWLIEWAIGLRAAVAISSERERGTWDGLMTSPLDGSEIVLGKLWGSLHALRWLIGSALLAWTIAVSLGGLLLGEYVELVVELATLGTLTAAIGVRTSLRSSTATRAMGITIGIWLGAYLLGKALAGIVCVAVASACVISWMFAVQAGVTTIRTPPWFPMSFRLGMDLVFYSLAIVSTILIVLETRLRFDRVAGRMTGGAAAVAVERLIHGRPMAPVLMEPRKVHAKVELEETIG